MSLVKIPFLLSGAVAGYVTMTAPNPIVPVDQRAKEVSTFERFFTATTRLYTLGFKALIISGGLLEGLVIIASHTASHALSQQILTALVAGPPSLARRLAPSPLFLAGSALALLGGGLRWQCYRTLGRLFTFELAIRDGHALVTAGPYARVRHPGYAGGVLCVWGLGLAYAARGAWARECGLLATRAGALAAAAYAAAAVFGTASLFLRAPQEDELLRSQFGDEWDAYAKKVPYRIIPFVF